MAQRWISGCLALVGAGLLTLPMNAQVTTGTPRSLAANVVVPHCRVHAPSAGPVSVSGVDASVVIVDQAASTTLTVRVKNNSGARQEAEVLIPVPDSAAVRGFTIDGAGTLEGKLMPRDEARRMYDEIVARTRDPGLLEFVGLGVVRSSVFPVEPGAERSVRLVYDALCPADGNRVDFVLPRSDSIEYTTPWTVDVTVKSAGAISTVYSPSHEIESERVSAGEVRVRARRSGDMQPGAFRLSYLLEAGAMTATMFAYPEAGSDGGYFLLLAGLPADSAPDAPAMNREVTLVLDRSGSMNGEKIEQAREAALQVLSGLKDGELFNVISYNDSINAFSPAAVAKTPDSMKAVRAYLEGIKAQGGTNIHDALVDALSKAPSPGTLPIVLFLTDGLPTVGPTNEAEIREAATSANNHRRRIFTFGVGFDVNTALLEDLSDDTRGRAEFVLPDEDVEVKVASVFRRLSGPVMASPVLVGDDGRTSDVLPARLPDLFEGDQLVVLGRYSGAQPLRLALHGDFRGVQRRFEFALGLDGATVRHGFVPRLWASRKIGVLLDSIRALGADGAAVAPDDPRVKELVDEVVRLSLRFGIMTEYTAFFAGEEVNLAAGEQLREQVEDEVTKKAVVMRSGAGAMSQDANLQSYKGQTCTNVANEYVNAQMQRVRVTNIQQVGDRAYYKRGDRWVDSRALQATEIEGPDQPEEVLVGTDAYTRLVKRLTAEGRQGCLALPGDVFVEIDGRIVLVKKGC